NEAMNLFQGECFGRSAGPNRNLAPHFLPRRAKKIHIRHNRVLFQELLPDKVPNGHSQGPITIRIFVLIWPAAITATIRLKALGLAWLVGDEHYSCLQERWRKENPSPHRLGSHFWRNLVIKLVQFC